MKGAFFLATVANAMLVAGSPAHAAPAVDILVRDIGERDGSGAILVDLRLLNDGSDPQTVVLPDRVEAKLELPGESRTIWLERASGMSGNVTIPAGGFEQARYQFSAPKDKQVDGATISIPVWNAHRIAIALRPSAPAPQLADARSPLPADGMSEATPPPSDRAAGNAFLANLSAYEPIYAVYGPGTNSEARIQISFKYQLFGSRRAEGLPRSWRDGLYFAYTQRMFWDLGAYSSPFRNVDYQPELFYLSPSATLSSGVSLSAQGGIRHESNGRDDAASRSINSIYVAPMAAFPLGGGYSLSIAPRLSFFVGDKSDNPDIRRYRGNTALFMEVGEEDGLRLSTSTRFNFSSGKGAVSADFSYPLPRLLGGGPDFYLFGQSFIGYGENLLDYNRRTTRFRIGVALVR
ncbi:phospholipase A [Sphingobium sp. YC-XJ3]|uniref:phospholipase A n=1 Tax=Sphingobium sp. YC-XJ3 TaxID=3024245 RepID=UPI0023613B5F|nr:phospholipase A [Sphingobium sp. YC-XJ3]WDA35219.1 phospholipase A [Sphingobium sp. YC-XJ3]WDA37245.1 phospholipase A [Sphingobium sp. YC-XJ3]WDA38812.1 phospholipase A [Sphingobium sp. YC-XJ3]